MYGRCRVLLVSLSQSPAFWTIQQIGITELLYSFNVIRMVFWPDFQTLCKLLNAALDRRCLMPVGAPLSTLTVLPRYVIVSVWGRAFPSTSSYGELEFLRIMNSDSLVLIRRLNWLCDTVFISWICDTKAISSAKTISSRVEMVPCLKMFVVTLNQWIC